MSAFDESVQHEDVVRLKLHIEEFREKLGNINEKLTDHDCARFLIARKVNLEKSLEMVKAWYTWYTSPIEGCPDQYSPMDIINYPDKNEHVYTKHMPHSNLGHALSGSPIYWEKTGLISSRFGDIREDIDGDALAIRHIRQQEYMFQKKCAKASCFYKKNVSKQVIVFNLADLSYAIDTVALGVFRKTLVVDEAYYPEVCLSSNMLVPASL